MGLYNKTNKRITAEQVLHPLDKAAYEALQKTTGFEQLMSFVSKHSLERTYGFSFHSSYARITENASPAIHTMLEEAIEMFGGDVKKPDLFLMRSYDYSILIRGIEKQYVLISTSVLEEKNDEILWPIMASIIGGIKCKHGTIGFISEIAGVFNQFVNIPFLNETLATAILAWKRACAYTEDRAYMVACEDFNETVRHIYRGDIPCEMLEKIDFSDPSNDCFKQAEEFIKSGNTSSKAVKNLQIAFSAEQWKASRYMDLYSWYMSGSYDDIIEGNGKLEWNMED